MDKITQIPLNIEEVNWAANAAKSSIKKWAERQGYYNNRLNSHFKGKLGEIAIEKYLLQNGCKIDSHFRFSERENLSDMVVKIKNYTQICRLEVKTWDANYWAELGRCIAVDQYPGLKRKADLVVWCVIDLAKADELLENPGPAAISLAGWSKVNEISNAPIKNTGTGKMRKVKNYQLAQTDLRSMVEFMKEITSPQGNEPAA